MSGGTFECPKCGRTFNYDMASVGIPGYRANWRRHILATHRCKRPAALTCKSCGRGLELGVRGRCNHCQGAEYAAATDPRRSLAASAAEDELYHPDYDDPREARPFGEDD